MQENLNSYDPQSHDNNKRYTPAPIQNLSAFTTQDVNATGRQLTTGLRDLYRHMSETPDAYNPLVFLQVQSPSLPVLTLDPPSPIPSIRSKKS
jgi:hypothetical protein